MILVGWLRTAGGAGPLVHTPGIIMLIMQVCCNRVQTVSSLSDCASHTATPSIYYIFYPLIFF